MRRQFYGYYLNLAIIKKEKAFGIYKILIMKQTATEWLFEWMENKQYFIGNDLLDAFNQAKEMEKQQIVDAHGSKFKNSSGVTFHGYWINGEEYYNKTFNKAQK